jgi:hypothetical protein
MMAINSRNIFIEGVLLTKLRGTYLSNTITLSFKKIFPMMCKIMYTIRATSTWLESMHAPPLQHPVVGEMISSQASLESKETGETQGLRGG